MIKRKTKIVYLMLILTILLSGFSFNINAFANREKDKGLITYLTQDNSSSREIEGVQVNIKKLNDVNSINSKIDRNVWVCGDLLSNAEVKSKLKELFNEGSKIIVKKEGITVKEVTEYLGVNMQGMSILEDIDIEGKDLSNVELKKEGVLISNNSDGLTIAQINVQEFEKSDEVDKALAFTSKSAFADRIRGKEIKTSGIFKLNEAYALTTEWSPVNVISNVDYYDRVTVQSTISLQKNSGNPDSASNYYSLHKAVVEATPKQGYGMDDVLIYQSANGDGKVYDYGPKNTSTSQSFSVTIPWGVSYSFNLGTTGSSRLDTGGIGYNYNQIDFYPTNFLGYRTKTTSTMSCQPAVEIYQNANNARIKNWFQSIMKYNVQVYKCYSGNTAWGDPKRYYTSRGIAGY